MSRNFRIAFIGSGVIAFAFIASSLTFASPQRQPAQRQFPRLPPGYVRPPVVVKTGLAPQMRVEKLPTTDSHTYKVSFGTGDEIISGLTQFAEENHIVSAHITGIGGLISAKLGWGSPTIPGMKEIDLNSKCELVSLTGNISMRSEHPYVHLHGVVAFSDGSTKGGHVIEAHVDPIAEIFVVATAAPLPEKTFASPEQ